MFLRKFSVTKNGKHHEYWALMESVRTERGPRNRVVSYLGDVDEAARDEVQQAAEGHPSVQGSLFEQKPAQWVEVNVRKVGVERPRRFGDVWLALELIKKLGLNDLLDRLLPEGTDLAEDVPVGRPPKIAWARLAEVLIVSRFCEPSSELHIAESFYRKSALADLVGIPDDDVYANRLYRTLDKLLEHKDAIQKHLKERMGELFDLTYDILLYDITSTYFEGEEKRNAQARRGYSRDSRPDCPQVCIGMVVTKEGIPLGYEVFEGNRHDSTTVEEMVEKMESLYGKSDRVWIMDRGMASDENLEVLAEERRRYIIGTPKSELKRYEQELLAKDWKEVHEGLEVKLCPAPDGSRETFILCRSAARREKEHAMHDRFMQRLETGLEKLKASCDKGRPKDPLAIGRRIGRLLERYSRAASMVAIDVKEQNGRLTVNWKLLTEFSEWARLSEGCYLLRTNIENWTGEDLWRAYIGLTDVEAAFRTHKQDLGLRPIWHQREDRVQSHILICFLAYVLWKCMGQLCKHAELGNEPRRVIEEIKTLLLVDVVLATRSGAQIRLRCVSKPEPPLAQLLHSLRMKPPERLEMKLQNVVKTA